MLVGSIIVATANADGAELPPGAEAHVPGGARSFLGAWPSDIELCEQLRQARIQRLRPVGTSSVVFKMTLHGDVDGALKLPSRDRRHAAAAEIAAYRLAQALGMDNVPPAVSRRLGRVEIQRLLHPAHRKVWTKLGARVAWDAEGATSGAVTYWVPGLRDAQREGPERVRAWRRWLRSPDGPPEHGRLLAADVSTMLAFDYLIGNWDRFSGANLQTDGSGRRLILRDHDAAFPARLSYDMHRRILEHVLAVRRFSRGFVESVLALDRDRLRAAMVEASAPHSQSTRAERAQPRCVAGPCARLERWLDSARLDAVMDRRETLLSHVGALMREYGAEAVLAFP